ncbi:Oligosaccharide translocation protein rft1 [Cladochytrium tenue]|nr:Oligosaccharide translocation protein rft1 [Cladochytrium tenue]
MAHPVRQGSVGVSAVGGAVQLVLLQLWTRGATFALNQLALRLITREVLGVVAVEMELLLATLLFLSREAVRMSLLRAPAIDLAGLPARPVQRQPPGAGAVATAAAAGRLVRILPRQAYVRLQALVNFAYLPVAAGGALAVAALTYDEWRRSGAGTGAAAAVVAVPASAVLVYCIAAVVELATEPLYAASVAGGGARLHVRVRVEGAAVLARCVTALGLLILAREAAADDGSRTSVPFDVAVMAFAWAQLAYAACLAVGYWGHYYFLLCRPTVLVAERRHDVRGLDLLMPHELQDEVLAWSFAKQGFLKHLLTEGDKIMSVVLFTPAIQGDYALVERYGSLVARILFQPVEETGRMYFSKALGTKDGDPAAMEADVRAAAQTLQLLLRLYALLGLFFVAFGPNYSGLLIDVLAGRQFAAGTAPAVLAWYCAYVPAMAFNGVAEAFFQSLAAPADLARQARWLAAGWTAFVVAAAVAAPSLGARGVVAANLLAAAVRIGFSWSFVRRFLLEDAPARLRAVHVAAADVGGNADADADTAAARLRAELRPLASLAGALPRSRLVFAAFAVAWGATRASDVLVGWLTLRAKAAHLAVGILMFALTSVCM